MVLARPTSRRVSKLAIGTACAVAFGVSTTAHAQEGSIQSEGAPQITERLNPGIGTKPGGALERGLNETIRSGVQGGNLGDAVRRGVGEAAQSSIESPQQTLQRDQQLRTQQQLQMNQRAGIGTSGTIYQDAQGRSFYMDQQGRQVFIQPGVQGQAQWQTQGQSAQGQTRAQSGPTLGAMIEQTPEGVRVVQVQPGSAAEAAGLQSGDVLMSFNGNQVNDPSSLVQEIRSTQTGQPVDVVVRRNGEEQRLTATFQDRSEGDDSYSVAKPATDSQDSQKIGQLESELEALRKDFNNLKQRLNRMERSNQTGASIGTDSDLNSRTETDARSEEGAELNLDANEDVGADATRNAGPQGKQGKEDKKNAEAGAEVDADAEAELQIDNE